MHQHTLVVEVRKAHRTTKFLHTLLLGPLAYSIKEGIHDLIIVDEIDKSETGTFLVPHLVAPSVDNTGNTAYDPVSFVCQEIDGIAHFEGWILFPVQCHHLIVDQTGHMVRIPLV